MFESKILLPYSEKRSANISSWSMIWKVMQRNVWSDIANWRTEQLKSYTKSQLLTTTNSKKNKLDLLENCQKYPLKWFWNSCTWHVLEDLLFSGQWTNLHVPSPIRDPSSRSLGFGYWSVPFFTWPTIEIQRKSTGEPVAWHSIKQPRLDWLFDNPTKTPTQHDNLDLSNVDFFHQTRSLLNLVRCFTFFEEWLKWSSKGRKPTMRHVSRTHRVALTESIWI